ncbi:MAG: N-acetylglucosamine-6-phosphate deacetylase [Acidobacteria bacterium]|nr:N-acetylglucosamine-6-phosphate deacetylase [Acidobacteriota bacterium]
MLKTLTARRLITDTDEIDYPLITINDGRIERIETGEPNASTETLTASFFDVHVHGACSHDFMAASQSEIFAVGRFLATRGVAHYLPTTVTGPLDLTLQALDRLATAIEQGSADDPQAATPMGIHLEGPFVSHSKRGVHPEPSIREPGIELFQRFQQAARGNIRLMTLAPELPHALELIRYASATGVRVTMGHSAATAAETLAAIDAGATSSTHLFNAMRPLDHREPGIVGTILDRDDVYAEAICDGVHVHPAMIRLWLKMKGSERAILVTDGMSATGMPDGTYTLGDFDVEVRDGVCLAGETLAGSVLTMDKAVANLQAFTGSTLATAVRLASRNPARMMGMVKLMESTPGSPANFNVYSDEGIRVGSVLRGRRIE